MRSAVFCYAAADRDSARDLADYLELNCPLLVSLDEGRIESGDDMLEAAGRALSADHPLLLLSPDSVLTIWKRDQWEPVLFDEAHDNPPFRWARLLLHFCGNTAGSRKPMNFWR